MKKQNMFSLLLLLGTLLGSLGEASHDIPLGPDKVFVQNTGPQELKIMAYNVLNLFDAEKDAQTDDWLWLPRNYPGRQRYCQQLGTEKDQKQCSNFDWTNRKIDLKLNQIKKVVDFQGSKPDFLAVMEVENINVLRMLAEKLGYQYYQITDSPDKRGIDVGLLFNLKPGLSFLSHENLSVKFKSGRPGRDILRVDFEWHQKPLSIYVNHWPSQRNPVDERISAAQILAGNIDEQVHLKGSQWVGIAVGDFNTLENDQPNPFEDILHNPQWKNYLYDADGYGRQSTENPSLPYTPPGTYFYAKEGVWSPLDRIAITQNLIDGVGIEFAQESLRIPFPQFMSYYLKRFPHNEEDAGPTVWSEILNSLPFKSSPSSGDAETIRIPARYNFETEDENRRGFSDHLPVIFKLRNTSN